VSSYIVVRSPEEQRVASANDERCTPSAEGTRLADSLQLTASVGYGIRNTPERLAVSRKPIADLVETMMTTDSLQLTAYGRG